MEIPKAKDLEFTAMQNGPRVTNCNCCGKLIIESDYPGPLIATIPLDEDGSSDFSIIVCSDKCEHDYKNHPQADNHISDCITSITGL